MPATATVTSSTDTLRTETQVREHVVVTDEPAGLGGHDTAPTPYELLAAALAGCVVTTIRMYARRKGWDVGELSVVATFDGDTADPHCTIELALDPALDDERRARLERVAGACAVHRTLARGVTFEHAVAAPAAA
jgi:putative redox protein